MNYSRFIVLWLLCIFATQSIGQNNVLDDPEQLYIIPTDDILNTNITVKRTLYTINDLISVLDIVDGLSSQVLSISNQKPVAVRVLLQNGTIAALLNQSSRKLGYSWKLKDHRILFSAISVQNPIATKVSTMLIPTTTIWELTLMDKTIRNALTKWCNKTGWYLIWKVGADYPIIAPWEIHGSFEFAINEVLKSSQATDIPLKAVMHDNNKVLEIFSVVTPHN